MKFIDKLAMEHPEHIDNLCEGGAEGCPCLYGYEEVKDMVCKSTLSRDCDYCWNREIPGTEEIKTNKECLELTVYDESIVYISKKHIASFYEESFLTNGDITVGARIQMMGPHSFLVKESVDDILKML